MPDTQAFSREVSDGKTPFVLCYLTYFPVVAFNRVSGVYQLTYRRYILEVFREVFPVVTPWFYDDGIQFLPHLLSSVSNCVSAVSLLTAPYSVLRSQRNSFWCLLPTCLIELRIWWTIQSWTLVLGNTLCIASGKPFRPSTQHINISEHLCFEGRSEPPTRS